MILSDLSRERDTTYYAYGSLDAQNFIRGFSYVVGDTDAFVYNIGVDWKEKAYEAAVARFGMNGGYSIEGVKHYLQKWGYSEEEAQYGASKWAENPPAKTEIDWFAKAREVAENGQYNFYDTVDDFKSALYHCSNFTLEEVNYAAQFYKNK